jgi:hypothetical protein
MTSAESHQERLYFLLEQLQRMARELPVKFQQRMPYELLAELAASLAQGSILEIVKMLTEVQQATEKHLFQQRLQTINKQKLEKKEWMTEKTSPAEVAAKDVRMREVGREAGRMEPPPGTAAGGHAAGHPAGPEGLRPAGHAGEGRRARILCDQQSHGDTGSNVPARFHRENW